MTQPPTGPPPWGNYPPSPPQPERPGRGWQVMCGAVTGAFATVVLPFASLGLSVSAGISFFVTSLLLVPCVGVGLVCSATTRAWGIGVLIGWAIALVVAAGACVALLSGLE